jgi:hypothetical protein
MATTVMRPIRAHRLVITARGIFTTASSWAWVRGEAGDIATAGADIASRAKVEEDIMAGLAASLIIPTATRSTAAVIHMVERTPMAASIKVTTHTPKVVEIRMAVAESTSR